MVWGDLFIITPFEFWPEKVPFYSAVVQLKVRMVTRYSDFDILSVVRKVTS